MENNNTKSLFRRFSSLIASGTLRHGDLPDPRLLLAERGDLAIFYAPFDYVAPDARVVLVGITPGMVQARNSLDMAESLLHQGISSAEAESGAKKAASFSGPMRKNLVDLLDGVGINRWLGLQTTADLFGKAGHLVHFTSVLRYPVFYKGANYSGNPSPERSPFLLQQVEEYFFREIEQLKQAIFVPLGDVPRKMLEMAVGRGLLSPGRVLNGLPHPSGANAERIAYFLGRKSASACSSKCNTAALDAAKISIATMVEQLSQ